MQLASRIVVSPMAQYSASAEGLAMPWHLMHIGNLLVSGPALVIMEATAIEPRGRVSPRCLGLWSDAQVESLRPIAEFRDRYGGARLGIQLAHAGRKASVSVPWERQRQVPEDEGGWKTVGPTAIAYPGRTVPHSLTTHELRELIEQYVDAAHRAERVGFDLIELHCAHGYLLNSFLSPLSNLRTDEFGADINGRMRFPLQVFEAIRQAWPAHKPLGVRVSATDWIEGGWSLDDSAIFAMALKALGCDYVAASSGGVLPDQKIPVGPGYQVPLAHGIRAMADLPTLAVGLINTAEHAESVLQDGSADLIAVGRGMTYDPRWAWHAAVEMNEPANFPPQYARSHPSMRMGNPLTAFAGTN